MNPDSLNITIPYALPDSLLTVETEPPDTTLQILLCNDSVFAQYQGTPTVTRKSMFVTENKPQKETHPHIRPQQESMDWLFGVIILLLALTSIYINSHKFKIKDIFLSLFDSRTLDRVFRENNIRLSSLLPMSLIYIVSLCILAFQPLKNSLSIYGDYPKPLLFLIACLILAVLLLLKNGFINLLGNIFDKSDATQLYTSNSYIFNLVCGLLVTPLLLPSFFAGQASQTFLIISVCVVAIMFIIRLFRGFQLILTNSNSSNLHLFYYLCILEITPIIIVGKILTI